MSLLVYRKRIKGITLIEMLICIAIFSIATVFVLAAVQKTRSAALKIEATNAMRQTLTASHSFANQRGHFPDTNGYDAGSNGIGESAFLSLFPLLEAQRENPPALIRFRSDPSIPDSILRYTYAGLGDIKSSESLKIPPHLKVSSIALNPLVYTSKISFPHSINDGTSLTIAMTEHYGTCSTANFEWVSVKVECYEGLPIVRVPCSSAVDRRATFADGKMFKDIVPVTTIGPGGPVSHGSTSLTFQVRPPLERCDPRIPQSSFAGGILCGMADGSVRFVHEGISETVFWCAVTPDKNEVAILD